MLIPQLPQEPNLGPTRLLYAILDKLFGGSANKIPQLPREPNIGPTRLLYAIWKKINSGGGGGASIANTTNLIAGDGAGNGVDSGSSPADFATAAQGATADTAVQPGDLGTAALLDVGTSVGDVVQVQAGGKLPALDGSDLTNLPGGTPSPDFYTLAYAASLTPDASLYNHRGIIRITGMNGAMTLNPPINPTDGKVLQFWMTAVGATRALTFNASLKFPSEYTPTNPVDIGSGDKRIVTMQYDGTLAQWEIVNNLGDY